MNCKSPANIKNFMKKAYIFPGQGSQFPGMAKELYETNPAAREMLEKANEILGFRITDIMFDGTAEAAATIIDGNRCCCYYKC